jgi:hypothetical protein
VSEKEHGNEKSNWRSNAALAISLFTFIAMVLQFWAQSRGDLLANCALGEDAETQITAEVLTGEKYGGLINYHIRLKSKCLILNNGGKTISIIRARATEINNGKPAVNVYESPTAVVLYENSLADGLKLPITLPPGESKQVTLWLGVRINTVNTARSELKSRAFGKCVDKKENQWKPYSKYAGCLASEGFHLVDEIYAIPMRLSEYNNQGLGFQFLTSENISSTFEVDLTLANYGYGGRYSEKRTQLLEEYRQRKGANKSLTLSRGYVEGRNILLNASINLF